MRNLAKELHGLLAKNEQLVRKFARAHANKSTRDFLRLITRLELQPDGQMVFEIPAMLAPLKNDLDRLSRKLQKTSQWEWPAADADTLDFAIQRNDYTKFGYKWSPQNIKRYGSITNADPYRRARAADRVKDGARHIVFATLYDYFVIPYIQIIRRAVCCGAPDRYAYTYVGKGGGAGAIVALSGEDVTLSAYHNHILYEPEHGENQWSTKAAHALIASETGELGVLMPPFAAYGPEPLDFASCRFQIKPSSIQAIPIADVQTLPDPSVQVTCIGSPSSIGSRDNAGDDTGCPEGNVVWEEGELPRFHLKDEEIDYRCYWEDGGFFNHVTGYLRLHRARRNKPARLFFDADTLTFDHTATLWQGMSGGPLVCTVDKSPVLIGIHNSWSDGYSYGTSAAAAMRMIGSSSTTTTSINFAWK